MDKFKAKISFEWSEGITIEAGEIFTVLTPEKMTELVEAGKIEKVLE